MPSPETNFGILKYVSVFVVLVHIQPDKVIYCAIGFKAAFMGPSASDGNVNS
jgi:hypothetical protein